MSTFDDLSFDGENILTTIEHEDNDENCAFWNELIPQLERNHNSECQLRLSDNDVKYLPLTPNESESLGLRTAPFAKEKDKSTISKTKTKTVSTTTQVTTTITQTTTTITQPTTTLTQPTTTFTQPSTTITQPTTTITQPTTTASTKPTTTTIPRNKAQTDLSNIPRLKEYLASALPDIIEKKRQNDIIPNLSKKVSFRIGVKRPEQPKDWKFYSKPGNDPILLSRKSTTTLKPFRSNNLTTRYPPISRLTTIKPIFATRRQFSTSRPSRKPTWKPDTYDPFSRFPYYRIDTQPTSKTNENNAEKMYYPSFVPEK